MNLYKYLEEVYRKGNYKEKGYSLEEFMIAWLNGNFMSGRKEEFCEDGYLGTYETVFKINKLTKNIEFFYKKEQ